MTTIEINHGYIRVQVNGVEVSRHRIQDEAIQAATNAALAAPGSSIVITTDDIRVVANTAADTVPSPEPAPVPAPELISAPAPQPTSNAMRVSYVDPIDNSAKFYDVAYGRVLYVSPTGTGDGSELNPMSPAAIFQSFAPGTLFLFRGGQYTANYGGNWGARNFALGAAASGIALVGMPGEMVELISPETEYHGNIILTDTIGSKADDVTIAGFTMVGGGECVFGGGYDVNESGGKRCVVVGNKFRARYTGNSMTGLVSMQGDGCKVIGNEFADTGWAAFYNNNHAVYVQSGADDVLIEANLFRHLQLGHVIQIHQDGVAQQYDNVRVRRNKITAADPMNCRGITVSNIQDTSTVLVEENWLENVGQQFAALSIYGGQVTALNNTFKDILGGTVGKIWLSSQYGHVPTLYRKGNTITGGSGPDYGVDGVPIANIIDLP